MRLLKWIFLSLVLSTEIMANRRTKEGSSRRPHPCTKSSCYPLQGNLLLGREERLEASSTCGERKPERYCVVSSLRSEKNCFLCDSRSQSQKNSSYDHSITDVVYRNRPGTDNLTWWQSSNGVENVTIQLNLETEYQFTYMSITFKTFRPAAMLVERSSDFGKTWKVYRYFAKSCAESFPGISQGPRSADKVMCDPRYSREMPSSDGDVIMRVMPVDAMENLYTSEVQNTMMITNLRINLTKLHTLGEDIMDDDDRIREKYYYAITDMALRGSCWCYGHADRCLPMTKHQETTADMVQSRCSCKHNTAGLKCERCKETHNDLPWKPALGKNANACRICKCNNHSSTCHFDQTVYEFSNRTSGGVCDDCQHNTCGRNCEVCCPGYYKDPDLDVKDPNVCKPCGCDVEGSEDEVCDEDGQCPCLKGADGRHCERHDFKIE